MTLLVSLASYILASLHSHTTHIYNNNTFTHYCLACEFKKPFIISFITLRFIQLKINELLTIHLCVQKMSLHGSRNCLNALFLATLIVSVVGLAINSMCEKNREGCTHVTCISNEKFCKKKKNKMISSPIFFNIIM